jgi:hypothetical protein
MAPASLWHPGRMTEPSETQHSASSISSARDLSASLEFDRRPGLSATSTPDGVHASAALPGGLQFEWDTEEFTAQWDSGSRGATGGAVVLGFAVASREAVDDRFAELTAAGSRGRQVPYDTFWRARQASWMTRTATASA